MGKVGDRIKTLAIINTKIKLETWQETNYHMEGVLEEIEDEETNQPETKKMKRTKRRIEELEIKIRKIEKLCNTLK